MKCDNCREEFTQAGLILVINDRTASRICPACLTGAKVLQVTVKRVAPGKPFKPQCYQVLEATDEASALPEKT